MIALPKEYIEMKSERLHGFQTVSIYSLLSHIDLDSGFGLTVCMKNAANGHYLKKALIGRTGVGEVNVTPEAHAADGSYTSVKVRFASYLEDLEFRVESCSTPEVPLVFLITPLTKPLKAPLLVLESGFHWNRDGIIRRKGNTLTAVCERAKYTVYTSGEHQGADPNIPTQTPYLAVEFDRETAFSVNRNLTVADAKRMMNDAKGAYLANLRKFAPYDRQYEIIAQAINWDLIYDARGDRLLCPVSREWSIGWGGYVMFCWDTYFAGFLSAAVNDRFLAVSNILEMTLNETDSGLIPCYASGSTMKTEGRSQPPVACAMLREVYRKYGDKWLVEFLYPYLLRWNTWFTEHRMEPDGTLCWGNDPVTPRFGSKDEYVAVEDTQGARYESGLDNSPMYDDVPFNKETHHMMLSDVGLTGLFIQDTKILIEFAHLLGKESDVAPLTEKLERAERGLETLWDDSVGFYCNRHTDTGKFSHRFSPTNFYALFSDRVSSERKARIMKHYFDPNEFYGEWMLPSITRNDPAFVKQSYWRGRVWAPMNFLVYAALRSHPDLETMRKDLVEKSDRILLREWEEHRHIHENYNAITGDGCDSSISDPFYHWGALLATLRLIEEGKIPGFAEKLNF